MNLSKFLAVVLMLGTPSLSCYRIEDSNLKIVNGSKTEEFKAVVKLSLPERKICTATFVSDTTAITAAHCLARTGLDGTVIRNDLGEISSVSVVVPEIGTPIKILINPNYRPGPGNAAATSDDLAVLIFPPNSSSSTAEISRQKVKRNDRITIVGFGQFQLGDLRSTGTKHSGNNKVSLVQDEFIYIYGPGDYRDDLNDQATALSGDSGGPMFFNDEIVGVTVAGTPASSQYASIHKPSNLDFLKSTTLKGAKIPSLFGDMFVAVASPITGEDLGKKINLFFSVPTSVNSVSLCALKEAETCLNSQIVKIQKLETSRGRAFFKTRVPIQVETGVVFTTIGFDVGQKISQRADFMIERR